MDKKTFAADVADYFLLFVYKVKEIELIFICVHLRNLWLKTFAADVAD